MDDEIVQMGRDQAHHILPELGWVSYYLREPEDIEPAITLLAESFQMAQKQKNHYLVVEINRKGEKEWMTESLQSLEQLDSKVG